MDVQSKPPMPVRRIARRKWALASVTVGNALVIADRAMYHACRMAVSRWNKANGTTLQCNVLADGTLQVSTNGTTVQSDIVTTLEPSRDQFNTFLATLAPGTVVTIRPEHTQRSMDELDLWTAEYAESTNVLIESNVMADGSLSIRRNAT